MTTMKELTELIGQARARGALVHVVMDEDAKRDEGRDIIKSVHVANLAAIGKGPMPPIMAAEQLRAFVARTPAPRISERTKLIRRGVEVTPELQAKRESIANRSRRGKR